MEEEEIDEQQDWRFISENNTLPKRGEKDFEPDGTGVQSSTLKDSRNAMYEALSQERKHASKNHIRATWFSDLKKARVDIARGPHFTTIGKADSSGVIWLCPEEVIYLVERGSMELWYPNGVSMPLQAVYASVAETESDLDQLHVYSYLKKIGYIVMRANEEEESRQPIYQAYTPSIVEMGLSTAKAFLRSFKSKDILADRKCYRSYMQIYKDLEIIPYHKPPHNTLDPVVSPKSQVEPFTITYNVWKPSTQFRKANPGEPHYKVCVVSARHDRMPTLDQISRLFDSVPVNEDTANRNQYQRLKEGWRSVLIAVVDCGITSFFRVNDVSFGEEKMYLPQPPNQYRRPPKKRQGK
ncbi:tRNA-splicing endonuclease subunit Sen54p [Trichomonascus vanleenenianus]|uniref:tRNA splicing endonuclease subunit SEN54 n=1 Tax=Trichomonascus vanleenenianus TaxID=2268995 RepID=UPI003ECAC5ED